PVPSAASPASAVPSSLPDGLIGGAVRPQAVVAREARVPRSSRPSEEVVPAVAVVVAEPEERVRDGARESRVAEGGPGEGERRGTWLARPEGGRLLRVVA